MPRSLFSAAQMRVLALAPRVDQVRIIRAMTAREVLRLDSGFEAWAHKAQLPPSGEGWRTWLMMAGRGFGKTRAGAEWVHGLAMSGGKGVRIALVGATIAEARAVMVEGESGIRSITQGRDRPKWEPSLGRLTWRNGAQAFIYSGEDGDALRGAQHHYAWCDELAKWTDVQDTWDNLQFGLRLGDRPRSLITTTPKTIPIFAKLRALPGFVETRGRTDENINLPDAFVELMVETYGGTRLGRQELNGELIEDVEDSLWPRGLIERCRITPLPGPACQGEREYVRVVVGVDPPGSVTGDACGIVAVGLGEDGVAYVLGDHSARGLSPEGWARRVASAARVHGADRVVAEKNMGGDMVESVLRNADAMLPVTCVHASRGKAARAAPVSHLFERGKARFAGAFPELEDELAGLTTTGPAPGMGSPDRADAMVWAMTELMRSMPRAGAGPKVWAV